MDYQELKLLEDDLWEAADQLRANSKLTASEYSMPVLGLIFLRHATTRFDALLPEVEKAAQHLRCRPTPKRWPACTASPWLNCCALMRRCWTTPTFPVLASTRCF